MVVTKDPGRGHFFASIVKSILRICGFFVLITGDFVSAGIILILAEVLGIAEEII